MSTGDALIEYSAIIGGAQDVVIERYASLSLTNVGTVIINQATAGTQRRPAFALIENKYNWLITSWQDEVTGHADIYVRAMQIK